METAVAEHPHCHRQAFAELPVAEPETMDLKAGLPSLKSHPKNSATASSWLSAVATGPSSDRIRTALQPDRVLLEFAWGWRIPHPPVSGLVRTSGKRSSKTHQKKRKRIQDRK